VAVLKELALRLLDLEAAAAEVHRALEGASPEQIEQAMEAFGPPRKGYTRIRWEAFWIAWCRECAERLPCDTRSIPPESDRDLDMSSPLLRIRHRDAGED
jgi:hypothetical protein